MSKNRKIYILSLLTLLVLTCTVSFSYAYMKRRIDTGKKIDFVAGTLNYKLVGNNIINNEVTIKANSYKNITVHIESLNPINSKYELYYNLVTDLSDKDKEKVEISYFKDKYKVENNIIEAKDKIEKSLKIVNNLSEDVTIKLGVQGGLPNAEFKLTDGKSIDKNITVMSLGEDIIKSNEIITESPSFMINNEIIEEKDGLYQENDVDTEKPIADTEKPIYYFRGNVKNNFLSFANQNWRILRINEDGTIRLIKAEPIKIEENQIPLEEITEEELTEEELTEVENENKKLYYDELELKNEIEKWYNNDLSQYNEIIKTSTYCGDYKTSATIEEVNEKTKLYNDYISSYNCTEKEYQLKIGLISVDEVIHSGAYLKNDKLTNLMTFLPSGLITMSPAQSSKNYDEIKYWKLDTKETEDNKQYNTIEESKISDGDIYPVINLATETIVTGTGTEKDPYVVINE